MRSVGEAPRPYLHLPANPSRSLGLIVRTAQPSATALPMLRDALLQLEPDIVFTEDVSAEQVAATTVAPTRIGAMMLGAFGALALVLAAIGVYGVIAYSVSRRTREVGIRMALGAPRATVLRMVLWQGGRLAAIGIAIGAVAAIGVGRVLESLLYGVSTVDPVAYAIACGVLLLVATRGQSLVPRSRRAESILCGRSGATDQGSSTSRWESRLERIEWRFEQMPRQRRGAHGHARKHDEAQRFRRVSGSTGRRSRASHRQIRARGTRRN